MPKQRPKKRSGGNELQISKLALITAIVSLISNLFVLVAKLIEILK